MRTDNPNNLILGKALTHVPSNARANTDWTGQAVVKISTKQVDVQRDFSTY